MPKLRLRRNLSTPRETRESPNTGLRYTSNGTRREWAEIDFEAGWNEASDFFRSHPARPHFRSPREGGTIEDRPPHSVTPAPVDLDAHIERGKLWRPLDADIKAVSFRVAQVGGLFPDDVFGRYEYANGRTRDGKMKRATLEAHWTPLKG